MSVKDDGALQVASSRRRGGSHTSTPARATAASLRRLKTRCTCSGRRPGQPREDSRDAGDPPVADEAARLLMRFVLPVWQDAADESHPARRAASPACCLRRRRCGTERQRDPRHPLREDRLRLGHRRQRHLPAPPGGELHRKNAFEARTAKMPTISFARINEIQKTLMLAGKEGRAGTSPAGTSASRGKSASSSPTPRSKSPAKWAVPLVGRGRRADQRGRGRDSRDPGAGPAAAGGDHRGLRGRHRDHRLADGALVGRPRAGGRAPDGRAQEVEQRYRSLVENAGDVIFTADRAGTILSINASGPRRCGCRPSRSSAATSRRSSPARRPRSRCWRSTRSSRARRVARSPTSSSSASANSG